MAFEKKREFKRPKQDSPFSLPRKRKCRFCLAKQNDIDYKDTSRLSQFVSERGKMLSKRVSGNCSKHQRRLACAIRRARFLALFPSK